MQIYQYEAWNITPIQEHEISRTIPTPTGERNRENGERLWEHKE